MRTIYTYALLFALSATLRIEAQTIQVYRKNLGLEQYMSSKVDSILSFYDGIEYFHEIRQGENSETIYVNDIDSIICTSEGNQQVTGPTVGRFLADCLENPISGYQVWAKLTQATGFKDSLNATSQNSWESRFTLFAEPDTCWEKILSKPAADITVEDIKGYILQVDNSLDGTNDNEYTNDSNVVHQFVAYHILPVQLSPYQLVVHANEYAYDINRPGKLTIPVMDYYQTMNSRLLKVYESAESNGIYLNRFPVLDNSRHGTGHEISCSQEYIGVRVQKDNAILNLTNGIIYPIEGLLLYDTKTKHSLADSRLRFDAITLFPELLNLGIRRKCSKEEADQNVSIPVDTIFQGSDNLEANDETSLVYFNGYKENYCYYQGDVLNFNGDSYNIVIKLPPIPATGTYQFRIGSTLADDRSLYQLYFGEDKNMLMPMGIPQDWRTRMIESSGWKEDTNDDETNALHDKNMRNLGFCKGPFSYGGEGYESARNNPKSLRNIGFIQKMEVDKSYYIRIKNVWQGNGIFLDYIELVPESIYNNPNIEEDIW